MFSYIELFWKKKTNLGTLNSRVQTETPKYEQKGGADETIKQKRFSSGPTRCRAHKASANTRLKQKVKKTLQPQKEVKIGQLVSPGQNHNKKQKLLLGLHPLAMCASAGRPLVLGGADPHAPKGQPLYKWAKNSAGPNAIRCQSENTGDYLNSRIY